MSRDRKFICLIFIFFMMFLCNSKVMAVSEKYEVIESQGWGTATQVIVKNKLNEKKATEYIVAFPSGSYYNLDNNSNPFCVYPIYYLTDNYIYFPLSNSCKTDITYSGLTNGSNSSNFTFNVTVDSSLPELKKCSDEQKNSLGFEDNNKSECYYCSSHQCLGDIKVSDNVKEVGIIYKNAKNALQISFGMDGQKYQRNNKYTSVNIGMVDSVKSIKDKSSILIKLNGQSGKLQYLTRYNDNSISGAGVIEVGESETLTTLTKGCTEDYLDKIKKISGVGNNLSCYYCDKINCQGDIKVDNDVDTLAIIYKNAVNTVKISLNGSK